MAIEPGMEAPDFTAPTDSGGTVSLKDFRGKTVVLYFYPKDNTSGCTKEACDFRDSMERITATDSVVIGVSPDNTKSHDKFKAAHNLNFQLVSDTDKTICEQYGVWVEKSMYGRKYMGVERSTFIIDPHGTITHVFHKVKVRGHVDTIIKTLQQQA